MGKAFDGGTVVGSGRHLAVLGLPHGLGKRGGFGHPNVGHCREVNGESRIQLVGTPLGEEGLVPGGIVCETRTTAGLGSADMLDFPDGRQRGRRFLSVCAPS